MKKQAWEPIEILTDDGRIIGLLPQTELLHLFNQLLVHVAHHQGFTL